MVEQDSVWLVCNRGFDIFALKELGAAVGWKYGQSTFLEAVLAQLSLFYSVYLFGLDQVGNGEQEALGLPTVS